MSLPICILKHCTQCQAIYVQTVLVVPHLICYGSLDVVQNQYPSNTLNQHYKLVVTLNIKLREYILERANVRSSYPKLQVQVMFWYWSIDFFSSAGCNQTCFSVWTNWNILGPWAHCPLICVAVYEESSWWNMAWCFVSKFD